MKRRIAAAVLALLFTFTAGRVYALIPLIPGVVPALTYLGVPGSLATALDFSIVLHAAVLAIAFNHEGGAATSPTSAPLTVKLNPKDPLPTPAGWTAAIAPNIHPVPPATAAALPPSYYIMGAGLDAARYSTQEGACAAVAAGTYFANAWGPPISYEMLSGGGNCRIFEPNSPFRSSTLPVNSQAGACPAGYTLSAGVCNLSNAAVVPKPSDNNCQIIRVGNTYSADTRDPDCASGSPQMAPGNVSIVPSGVTITGANGVTAQLATASDGTSTATECYPDIANNKTNCLTTKYSAPDASGKVTLEGILTNATAGVGDVQQTNTGAATDAAVEAITDKLEAQDDAADAAAAAAPALPPDPATVSSLGLPTSNPFSAALPSSVSNFLLPSNSESCVALDVTMPVLGALHIAPCVVVDVVRPMVNYLIIALGVIGGVLAWMRSDNEAAA